MILIKTDHSAINNPIVITNFLLVYGLCHALVDAASAFLVMGTLDVKNQIWLYIIVYNTLAFCLQVPFGLLIDKYPYPKYFAFLGMLFILIAYLFFNISVIAVLLVGIGNALFHVGGGQVALNIDHNKAVYPGIFVAPGGIGLALGIYLAFNPLAIYFLLFPTILLVLIVMLFFTKVPTYSKIEVSTNAIQTGIIIIFLLMISISIRSLIGLTINFPWKISPMFLILLTLAIALGKVFGGILADRFGWIKTGISGLLLAAPFLAFGSSNPIMGLVGIFVFNFTMPITLVAISTVLPGRAGLAFGLTALALFIGAFPTYGSSIGWLKNEWTLFVFILLAAIFLFLGLFALVQKKSISIKNF